MAVWPALLLPVYVFYPFLDFTIALAILVAAGLAALLTWQQGRISRAAARWRWWLLLPLLLGAGFFALYVATLAPDVLPADSGELQIVATTLGVAHPPGFPLYTLLGHVFTRLPLGATPAFGVNLLSAVTSTLTLLFVYAAALRLTGRQIAPVVAAVTLGTATTFWSQATTANVRSLTAFFAAVLFWALVNFRDHIARGETTRADRYLVLAALALGFGVTHHASLAFIGVVSIIFVFLTDGSLWRSPRRWVWPMVAGLGGLLPLLYLPLRARADVRGASPGLATWSGFLNHALALGFRGDFFYFTEPALLWERLKVMGNVMTFQFSWPLLLGMVGGFVLLLWRRRGVGLLLGGSFLVHTLVTATYRAPQTVEYMLPAYVAAALLLGYFAGTLWSTSRQVPGSWQTVVAAILSSTLLLLGLAQLVEHAPSYRALHLDPTARSYAQPLLVDAPADAVLLADWHWATPLWYLQEVEGLRPDVEVRFVFPAGEPYGVTWASRVSQALEAGRPVISTHFDPVTYAELPVSTPLHEAFLFGTPPVTELPERFMPLALTLGETIRLSGYHLAGHPVEPGEPAVLTLAWEPVGGLDTPLTLFAHLLGPEGALYAQEDVPARPREAGLTLTQFRLAPRPGAVPGVYTVAVGAYGAEVLLNEAGAPRSVVAELAVTPNALAPFTQHGQSRPLAEAGAGRLVGLDWDHSVPGARRLYLHWQGEGGFVTEVVDEAEGFVLPAWIGPWGVVREGTVLAAVAGERYVPFADGIVWTGRGIEALAVPGPGERFVWPHFFGSSGPVTRDYVVSVRLIGFEEDGFRWAWWHLDDSVPAMGAIPTLKWIQGSRVRSPHFVTVSPDAARGQAVGGALTLYDGFTGRRLAILDERITAGTPWVPLGRVALGG